MQMTKRDQAMLDWLSVVRLADVDAVRWALGGLAGSGGPVTTRRANVWISRLVDEGLLGRARPNFRDGSVIWATHQAIGKTAPNLFRQTTRHEVAVASVSARYLAHGYTWARDRKPASKADHQTDGVATKGDVIELVEVELTPKTIYRYRGICASHTMRMQREGVSRVVYFGTPEASRVIAREADTFIFRDLRPRLLTMPVLDVRGSWEGGDFGLWGDDKNGAAESLAGDVVTGELDGLGSWSNSMERGRP